MYTTDKKGARGLKATTFAIIKRITIQGAIRKSSKLLSQFGKLNNFGSSLKIISYFVCTNIIFADYIM